MLLTRQWRDMGDGLELVFWAVSDEGPVRVVVDDQRAVCFVARDTALPETESGRRRAERKALELTTLDGAAVDGLYFVHGLYFRCQRDLTAAREDIRARGVTLYESDLKPNDRYLMERFVNAAFSIHGAAHRHEGYLEFRNPQLKRDDYRARLRRVSLDVESDGLSGQLYSIAAHGDDVAVVFIVSDLPVHVDGARVVRCRDEKALLETFFDWLAATDPDLILGWNVINFDLDLIEQRCRPLGVEFAVGRGGDRATILQPQNARGTKVARVPGRVVLDGIDWLRAAFWSFESFELEAVARALLGRGKHDLGGGAEPTDKVAEINRLYREDRDRLAAYNLEDCRLVTEIFARANLVEFAVRRAELTGLAMDRQGGSVAAFDNLYLPRLHRRGRVAPDVGDAGDGPGSPGGYVMDSDPGLYDNVLVLDFKSLYPSIIRTFQIDPLGLAEPGDDPVPGFLEARFARRCRAVPGRQDPHELLLRRARFLGLPFL
jgi:DNA polymerase-2